MSEINTRVYDYPGVKVAEGYIHRFNIIMVKEKHRVTRYKKEVGKWYIIRRCH